MNNSVSFLERPGLNRFVSILVVMAIFIIYFSPFWWPSSNTNAVALVRAFVFISAFVFFIKTILFKVKNNFKVNFNLSVFLILLLFSYLIINTYFLSEDTKPIRRILFLIMFFISIYFLNIRPVFSRWFFILLAFSGFCFAAYSLVSIDRRASCRERV